MGKGKYLGEFEQLVLLALFRLGSEGYGMTVRREIYETTGRDASIGSVYATLERLESKGLLVSSHSDIPEGGGKPRRTFAVTPAGVQALVRSRDHMTRMWQGVSIEKGAPTS